MLGIDALGNGGKKPATCAPGSALNDRRAPLRAIAGLPVNRVDVHDKLIALATNRKAVETASCRRRDDHRPRAQEVTARDGTLEASAITTSGSGVGRFVFGLSLIHI